MKFAICFRTRKYRAAIWVKQEAENAREAVEEVKKEFTVYEILGVYKEQQEWKWR